MFLVPLYELGFAGTIKAHVSGYSVCLRSLAQAGRVGGQQPPQESRVGLEHLAFSGRDLESRVGFLAVSAVSRPG